MLKTSSRPILYASAMVLAVFAGNAMAAYPDHAITAIVPFAAGSSNDTVARIIAPQLSLALGQPVIVTDKPGADGLIGIGDVARAQPDGYTILFSAGAVVIAPALHKRLAYDPVRQIVGIAAIGASPYIIGVSSKLGINTLGELLDYVRKNPGKLNVPTSGNSSRAIAELFKSQTGLQFTIINFNGTGEAATSLLSGETDFGLLDSLSYQAVTADRVKLLAVVGNKRAAALPDVPSTAEAGLPEFTANAYFGVFGTGGTPSEVTHRINAEVNRIIAMPEVVNALGRLGVTPTPDSSENFSARYQSDLVLWKGVVAKAKIPLAN